MSALNVGEQVRWQDLKIRSELDIVFEIAAQQGWKDCEVFGSGAMITQPQESMGWKLIPADRYEASIPPQAVARLHEIINAGVRVQGVIIADDERHAEPVPVPTPAPVKRKVSLPSLKPVVSWIGKVLLGLVHLAGTGASLLGKVLLALIRVTGVVALIALGIYALIHFFLPVLLLGSVILIFTCMGGSTNTESHINYDPKLVVLVDNGEGGTTWISLFTWYD